MISKNTVKFLKSLHIKKYRKKENAFLVEGAKNVLEVLKSDYKLRELWITSDFHSQHADILAENNVTYTLVGEHDLDGISAFKTNNAALALMEMKELTNLPLKEIGKGLALDDIRDPGNLGTIIRIADWYAIDAIVCSPNCADYYNPKVIAASMGSFSRVPIIYDELEMFLKNPEIPVMGTFMSGELVHTFNFPKKGWLVIGNESSGVSTSIGKLCNHKISIPKFGSAESLNAAIATAIICDNWNRNESS